MAILGITAYPDLSPIEKIRDYFQLASRYGASRAVSSMLSVEGSREEIIEYFRKFIFYAHEYGMKVSLDVNTGFMKKMGQSYEDISLFHEIGCDTIRLDGSYGAEDDYIMTQNPYGIEIEMNASSGRVEKEIAFFSEKGVGSDRVRLCHNLYPQRYTGLKWKDFLKKNRTLRKYGYSIAAFVSSNAPNTHGLWGAEDGLPTVERLRDLPIDLQARIMLATGGVNEIMIGNAYASEKEFEALSDMLKPPKPITSSKIYEKIKAYGPNTAPFGPCKRLKVILEKDITPVEKENLLEFVPQLDNGDSSEWIWRSRYGRLVNEGRMIPPRPYEGEFFPVGSVVIVNDTNRHYSGELQIVKEPIINDGKRNLIAKLAPHEEMMLELIQANDLVEFYEYSEY